MALAFSSPAALMVEPPSPTERIFLDILARALGLEAGLAQQIQATVLPTGSVDAEGLARSRRRHAR